MANRSHVFDPLGIDFLHREIVRFSREYHSITGPDRERRLAILEGLSSDIITQYQLLKDRYSLLKNSNRMLFEELAWLRDQCDDFALERSDLLSPEIESQSVFSSSARTENQ